jgi:hypothetical protein
MTTDTTREAVEARAARMEAAAIAYKELARCCGEVCSGGVCAAPACHFGEVMGGLQDGATTLRALLEERERLAKMHTDAFDAAVKAQTERDAARAECERLRSRIMELDRRTLGQMRIGGPADV